MYYTRSSIAVRVRDHLPYNRRKLAAETASVSAFLSHSHDDSELAKDVKDFLGTFDVDVFVDSLDWGKPDKVDAETARLLRGKVVACEKFILLATTNGLTSRWVPWELGCADGTKSAKSIAVLPVADEDGRWPGNEYVGLYARIIVPFPGIDARVVTPGGTAGANEGVTLGRWLRSDPTPPSLPGLPAAWRF